jgi:hypothetical protein
MATSQTKRKSLRSLTQLLVRNLASSYYLSMHSLMPFRMEDSPWLCTVAFDSVLQLPVQADTPKLSRPAFFKHQVTKSASVLPAITSTFRLLASMASRLSV